MNFTYIIIYCIDLFGKKKREREKEKTHFIEYVANIPD